MKNGASYERLIAKLQHFADGIENLKSDAEFLLITNPTQHCAREKIETSIFLYDKILQNYYDVFDEILDR